MPLHIGLIFGRYLQFRFLKWPLINGRFLSIRTGFPIALLFSYWDASTVDLRFTALVPMVHATAQAMAGLISWFVRYFMGPPVLPGPVLSCMNNVLFDEWNLTKFQNMPSLIAKVRPCRSLHVKLIGRPPLWMWQCRNCFIVSLLLFCFRLWI